MFVKGRRQTEIYLVHLSPQNFDSFHLTGKKKIFFFVQMRLTHQCHLLVGTPALPALNSPAWMEPASPLQW